ncbi:hypothetical protein DPEC_G00089460 [Dallia pectoralis]|uniref:Uncharacterized protein n=1 Tax=Dallia pectoralis TaxID=75939 RepID=A0ACC2H0D7_DALPE|nr:hypothetical protein DPEC_G00089460 [Dallia pectoralis]
MVVMLLSLYLQILWNFLKLCLAVRPLVVLPREAMLFGPVRSNQGPNSLLNPSPHPAGLGSPTHPAAPTPAPAPSQVPSQPSAPKWPVTRGLNPRSRWPFSPGESGWPGQIPRPKSTGSGWPFSPGQDPGSQSGVTPAPQWTPTPTGHLNVPYNLNLKKGIYDKMMITITGQVKPNAKQFTVNFVRGTDIAFHLNPRFNDKGKQAVVRNTKVGECWGTEERKTLRGFPFMAGQSFEMKILITFEEFKVAVNGAQLFEYKHRVRQLNQIDRINILQDVLLTYVSVDTIP